MKRNGLALLLLVVITITGCKKNNDAPKYTVPTTYNFTNVSYSDPTTRLKMVTEIQTVMNTGATGTVLNAQKMKDMFANVNNQFVNDTLNTSGIQLKDQNPTAAQTDLQRYMDSLALASQSSQPASNGVAGIGVSTTDPTKKYLLSANGINYAQVFTKSIMGSLIAYQIENNYMASVIAANLDNAIVVPGQGTAMEHAWDQAIGYFAVPVDFPTNKTGLKFYASYCNQVDSGFHSNALFMNAFLKGRAAISNKDLNTASAQATAITQNFEKLTAACALHEINEAKQNLADVVKVNSNLSECMGFILSMKYNPKRTIITDQQIDTILGYFGTNFYNLTPTDIDNIQNSLSTIYGFDSVKSYI